MAGSEPLAPGVIAQGEYESITLHSSWFGIVTASAGAGLLVFIAYLVLSANGFGVVPILIGLAAVGAAFAVLFDMPIATTFSGDGIVRHTPLRRHRLAWDDVTRLMRNRSAIRRRRSGGLIAGIGPVRQVMLVDRMEGHQEFAAVRQVMPPDDRMLLDSVEPPALDRKPTWVGRRAKWRPPSAV